MDKEEKTFYVYAYFRLDNNSFFYIGKGKGKRCYSKQGRPKHFTNIIKKVPYVIVILYNTLNEEMAFKLEKEVIENLIENNYSIDIKGYRKKEKHLTNQCWGGKGGLGGVPKTEDTKRKLSELHTGKMKGEDNPKSRKIILLNTYEIFNSISEAVEKYNVNITSIVNCCQNKYSYGGKFNDENLVWMYLEDYNNISEDELEDKIKNIYKKKKGSFNGKKHSKESIEKMRKSLTGKTATEDTKKKLSEQRKGEGNSMWGKRGEKSPHWGKEYSKERKDNISKALGTAVRCIELDVEFNSLTKAEIYMKKYYNIKFSHKTLKSTIEGGRKTDWYGEIEINGELVKLHWEYC